MSDQGRHVEGGPRMPAKSGSTAALGFLATLIFVGMAGSPALAQQTEVRPSRCEADGGTVEAEDLVECVSGGGTLDYSGVTVVGDVDLTPLETVGRPLRCLSCTFKDGVIAKDVVFERVVDYANSVFEEGVRFDGAVFESAAVFRSARPAGITSDPAVASFTNAVFSSIARFDTTVFHGDAKFTSTVFSRDAAFQVAKFFGDAVFSQASVGGDLKFERATFAGKARFLGIAVQDTMSLVDVTITLEPGWLDLGEKMEVGGLEMPLNLRGAIDASAKEEEEEEESSRELVLRAVELTARRNGNLNLANDAEFYRVSEDSDIVEFVFGRLMAGYTIQPIYPLTWLLVVLLAGTLVRWRFANREARQALAWLQRVRDWIAAPWLALRSSWYNVRGKPRITHETKEDRRTGAEAVEFFLFAIFAALFLIALGNSLPIARDLIQSVLG